MIPIFGVGKTPAIVALFIYVLLPILNNTVLGVQNIDSNIKEAGKSMGMTQFQLMKDVGAVSLTAYTRRYSLVVCVCN